MPLRTNNFYKEIDKSFIYMLMYISRNRFYFIKLKKKGPFAKISLIFLLPILFPTTLLTYQSQKKETFFVKFSTQCRCGSRGGEMGEFSPPPPLFLSPLLFFLITSTRLWFYYIITKIRLPPHYKLLDPHSCAIKSPQLYTPSPALTFILKLLVTKDNNLTSVF